MVNVAMRPISRGVSWYKLVGALYFLLFIFEDQKTSTHPLRTFCPTNATTDNCNTMFLVENSLVLLQSLTNPLSINGMLFVSAFGTLPRPTRRIAKPGAKALTTTAVHSIIFTRFSPDCFTAMAEAQVQANALKLNQVNNGCLLAGICLTAGDTSTIGTTLAQSSIDGTEITKALQQIQRYSNSSSSKIPKLSDFAPPSNLPMELPLSTSLQQTLFQAGQLSAVMNGIQSTPSSTSAAIIEPHHVFLALLNYQEIDGIPQAASRSDPDCEAMDVVWQLDATLEAQDLCTALLQNLLSQQRQNRHQKELQEQERQRQPPQSTTTTPTPTAVTSTTAPPSTSSSKQKDAVAMLGTGAAMSEAKEKARSLLQECGTDLTRMAQEGQLDIVHGRQAELQACCQTLVRRRKNNVCLIGEAGVGKTCIVEALAQLLVSDQCPSFLVGHRIISLEVGALVAGTKFRGELEERLRTIIEILSNSRTKSILFLDEIHNLVGAGGNSEGNLDASNILKPYLARGQLQVIGATTITEYQRYIAKDAALERRFQPILVREPTVEETVDILKAVLPFYQSHHKVEYTMDSLEAAARLSDRYINDRFLPDKAIDVLDQAGAMATLTRKKSLEIPLLEPPTVTDRSVTDIISQWTNIPVGKLEMDEMDRLQLLEEQLGRRVKGQSRAVRTVARAIRRARTGIRNPRRPVASFLFCGPTGTGKTELCKALADTYYGSERDYMIRIDMSEYMEKSSINRLTGPPPGLVGYEEGGQLTEAVRRSPHCVVLLDELEKAHSDVLNLLLQVLEDGILTDGMGRTISFKNTVLIMTSNIGSQRILDLVQQQQQSRQQGSEDDDDDDATVVDVSVLRDGKEKNSNKNKNNKKKTKNASYQKGSKREGDNNDDSAAAAAADLEQTRQVQRLEYEREVERMEYQKLSRVVQNELERALKPEFLNRIDDIVVFQPLTSHELSLIAVVMVVDITARARLEKNLDLRVSPELLNTMVEQGSLAASQFGARPMRRAVQRILEDAISDAVIQSFLTEGDAATFGRITETVATGGGVDEYEDGPLVVTVTRDRDGAVLHIPIDDSSRDLDIDLDDEYHEANDNRLSLTNGEGSEDREYLTMSSPLL